MNNRLRFSIVGIIVSLIAFTMQAAQPFRLEVVRDYEIGNTVFGTLYLNGERIGVTVENKRTLIPEGMFAGDMRYSEIKKSHVLGLDRQGNVVQSKNGDFLIELRGTPGGHLAVQVHVGNWATQSEGCILVGYDAGPVYDKVTKTTSPGVRGSMPQLIAIRQAFYGAKSPIASPNKAIAVVTSKAPGYLAYPDWPSRVRDVKARMSPGPIATTSSPSDRVQAIVPTAATATKSASKSSTNSKDPNDGPNHDSIAEIHGRSAGGAGGSAGNAGGGNGGNGGGKSSGNTGSVTVRDPHTGEVKSSEPIQGSEVTGHGGNQ